MACDGMMRLMRRVVALLGTCCAAAFSCQPETSDGGGSLLSWVRLDSSATRPREPYPWPREDQDAPACVRDGDSETGWRPVPDQPAWLRLDLAPRLGRTISLQRIEMTFTGDPGRVLVELAPACGDPDSETLPWSEPAAPLLLGVRRASCVTIHLAPPGDFVLTSLDVLAAESVPNDLPAPPAAPPQPSGKRWGVIEGFYGHPWSLRERRAMFQALSRSSMGLYLYAPKSDPYHRDRWREPYPEDLAGSLADLAVLARRWGVDFFLGISPLGDFDFDNASDLEALLAKMRGFLAQGMRHFALLADDIEFAVGPVDGALGEKHASLANRLLAELRQADAGVELGFVPTVYSEERRTAWPGGPAYLEALAALDPAVDVFWTGRKTSSDTMAPEDLAPIADVLRRPPVVWDNFFANDGGDMVFGNVFLSPFAGRSADLAQAAAGIALNPSIQGALSRLQLGTLAAFREASGPEDLEARLQTAAIAEAEMFAPSAQAAARDAETLAFVMRTFDGHANRPTECTALRQAVDDLERELSTGTFNEQSILRPLLLLARLSILPSEVHHSTIDTDLADDLFFPLQKAAALGDAGASALMALVQRLSGQEGAQELAEARAAIGRMSQNRFVLSPGLAEGLADAVGRIAPADRGIGPLAEGDPVPECRAGQRLEFRPFAGEAEIQVFGLTDAAATADGRLRWTPEHGGVFSAAVVGWSPGPPARLGFCRFELRCRGR